MSPKSRGRPLNRRTKQQQIRRQARRSAGSADLLTPGAQRVSAQAESTDYWFDEPGDDRRSWAIPAAHGTYNDIELELELELLNPDDEDDLTLLMEARHPELEDALRNHDEVTVDGEPSTPGCT